MVKNDCAFFRNFSAGAACLENDMKTRVTCIPFMKPSEGRKETEILDLFSIATEFNLPYKKDSFRIPFIITFD